jgi:hypothetical protein
MLPGFGRLNWLEQENLATASRSGLFRQPAHELEMEMMTRPLPAQRVYALLGLLLGTFPPFVIFCRLFGYGVTRGAAFPDDLNGSLIFLCLMMNIVCALVGYGMGRALSGAAFRAERGSWSGTIGYLMLLGIVWGVVTGATGGVFFFGFGAFVGPFFAIPIGVVSFFAFGIMHRLLERGGMIDMRHFLPLAISITAIVCLLIPAVK